MSTCVYAYLRAHLGVRGCAQKHLYAGALDAGLVGDFLSWPAFGPLSRMAPLVFLLHPLVQNIFTAYVRERVQADQLMAVSEKAQALVTAIRE